MVISLQMQLVILSSANRRQENIPTTNEIAAIIPNEYDTRTSRDIVLEDRALHGVVGL
jgi:hypothetical protein